MYEPLELLRACALSILTAWMLWSVLFWQRAAGCGYCGARRPDKHSRDCPFRKG